MNDNQIILLTIAMQVFVSSCILLLLMACTSSEQVNTPTKIFTKPAVVQPDTTDTLRYFKEEFIKGQFPTLLNKYTFTDTLRLSLGRIRKDTSFRKDYLEEYIPDTLHTDGFEIIPDYTTNLYNSWYLAPLGNCYYPVYIVNQAHTVKCFVGKDGYIFGIQEALDTAGKWRPIEHKGPDFCGNGYFTLRVHPKEFLIVLFPKYSGNYHTKLRVRIINHDTLYVSKPYEGIIDKKQFYLNRDRMPYSSLMENPEEVVAEWFYGAEPLEIAKIRKQATHK